MFQEDCPICKIIAKGVEQEWGRLCSIHWGSERIILVKDHSDEVSSEVISEVMALAEFDKGQCVLSDFSDVPGHWGVRLIPATSFAQGNSKTGT